MRKVLVTVTLAVLLVVPASRAGNDPLENVPRAFESNLGRTGGHVGFRARTPHVRYDPSLPLVIGPAVEFATYLGGVRTDEIHAIAVDSTGSIVVTGWTNSPDFPATGGSFGGGTDAFVAKFDPSGTRLIFARYLGGSRNDSGNDVAIGHDDRIHVTGWTTSTDFPVQDAYQPTLAGFWMDAFVTTLSSDGREVLYSTYFGGSGSDNALAIAVDEAGRRYITGHAATPGFPLVDALDESCRGPFVAVLAADGQSVELSTCLGLAGATPDSGRDVALGPDGAIFVTGSTQSGQLLAANAFQAARAGLADAFLTKIDPSGPTLVYSTYLGGEKNDGTNAIDVDSEGNAYVIGTTQSAGFPTLDAFQSTQTNSEFDIEAFVSKFDVDGQLVFSTYLGGSRNEAGTGLAVDETGAVYLCGWTDSDDFPVVGAFQPARGGSRDFYVARLTPSGSSLDFASYFGGPGDDRPESRHSLALDPEGSVVIAGYTSSPSFPVVDPIQADYAGGNQDAVVAKITFNRAPTALCRDAVVAADDACRADAIVDAGSYDPDGDPLSLIRRPPGPYSLGDTPVTLIVTDSSGASDECEATVSVLDRTPPTIALGLEAAGRGPGSPRYRVGVSATDACDPAPEISGVLETSCGRHEVVDGQALDLEFSTGCSSRIVSGVLELKASVVELRADAEDASGNAVDAGASYSASTSEPGGLDVPTRPVGQR